MVMVLDPEEACIREVREENGGEIEIVGPLSPMILWENPQTKKKMTIVLIHYLAKLKNKGNLAPIEPVKEVKWLDLNEIKDGKHKVAPNIVFLIGKGEIK